MVEVTGGDSLTGTLHAPNADLRWIPTQNIEGNVIARTFTHGPETRSGTAPLAILDVPFNTQLSCTADTTTTTTTVTETTTETATTTETSTTTETATTTATATTTETETETETTTSTATILTTQTTAVPTTVTVTVTAGTTGGDTSGADTSTPDSASTESRTSSNGAINGGSNTINTNPAVSTALDTSDQAVGPTTSEHLASTGTATFQMLTLGLVFAAAGGLLLAGTRPRLRGRH